MYTLWKPRETLVFLSVDLIVKWDGAQLDQPAGQHQELGRGVPSLGYWPGPCHMVTRGSHPHYIGQGPGTSRKKGGQGPLELQTAWTCCPGAESR